MQVFRRMKSLSLTLISTGALCLLSSPMLAADAHGDPEALNFYTKQVQPLLEQHCFKCHGRGEKIKGGLAMISRAGLLKGGDFGPAIDSKQLDQSLLLAMISYKDDEHEMPPKGKLDDDVIATLTRWVKLGAPMITDPRDAKRAAELDAADHTIDPDQHKNYWAYQPVQRPAVPAVRQRAWVRNPIDAFVLAPLEAAQLQPAAEADRATLIRRATYDLTGLPPTPEQVEAFAKDSDPKAYEKLIERLLSSPHYGEKWGRHWLDLVRFAETNGYERDSDKPHAWRYRDYVIKSFNDDKPYDRFLTEQLAGDELPDATAETHVATGYYRLGIWDDEPADRELAKYDVLDGIVSTTSNVMLGMSIGCARCHDHKKDPIPQTDYYSLLAFFHNITPMGKEGAHIERLIEIDPKLKAAHEQRLKEIRDQIESIESQFSEKINASTGDAPTGKDLEAVTYRYYRDTWDKLPKFDELKHETEGRLDHNLFDIGPSTRETAFGFVFEAQLRVPEDGEYTFAIDSDDGSRLIVDGKIVAEYDGIHGMFGPVIGTAKLRAGRVPVRLEYFQNAHGFGLQAAWSGPGFKLRSLTHSKNSDLPLPKLIEQRGVDVLGLPTVKQYQKLQKQLANIHKERIGEYALVVTERGAQAPDTFLLKRGTPGAHGEMVHPRFPTVLGAETPEIPQPGRATKTSGRRLALAQWITHPDNPMTARVMANRLWQYHFGVGIVPSSNDFGLLGELPTNQPLLDWLTRELIQNDWRLKAMHKQIMLSSTYRMASTDNPTALAKDPANQLLWRFPMRRLSAEEIRDSVLAVNGSLNPAVGGPSVYPPMPAAVLATSSHPKTVWGKSSPEQANRRSVYIKVKRSLRLPILASHDAADTDNSTATRFSTTVPTQALSMINSEFMHEQAARLADRLRREAGDNPAAQVRRALMLTTGRQPTADNIQRGVDLIRALATESTGQAQDPLQRFCLVALNLNAFVYID